MSGISQLDVAIDLAVKGYYVFPTREGDNKGGKVKTPYTRHGFKDATTNESIIRGLWTRRPNAMPAIATGASGLLVVDVDNKAGKNGSVEWTAICNQFGFDHQDWVIASTPSGGYHIYFRQHENIRIGNSSGRIAPGIDLRGVGGYVIAPGAMMADGGCYTLIQGAL